MKIQTILMAALCALVGACGRDAGSAAGGAGGTTNAETPRIVSTVPAATLNLVLIGAADRLVGVSTFDRDHLPADKQNLPVVGDHETINYEQLVSLHPTALVIQTIAARVPPRLNEVATEHHIEILNMKFDHVSDIWDSVRLLAKAAGRAEEGERAIVVAQSEFKELTEHYKDAPHPKVVFMVESKMICGGKTFIDEIITAAGGDNAGREAGDGFLDINREVLLKLAPEVLLISAPGERPATKDDPRVTAWSKLPIPAAKSGRIFLVTDPAALDASLAIANNTRGIAALIHKAGTAGAGGGAP